MSLSPSNTMVDGVAFPNYAGRNDVDKELITELENAGIIAKEFPKCIEPKGEVQSGIYGQIPIANWHFERAWYYWVASGPGIPPSYANELHKTHGTVVRVSGHCGCPSPLEWYKGFAVDSYHVDTADGLKALADTIKKVVSDAETMSDAELESEDRNIHTILDEIGFEEMCSDSEPFRKMHNFDLYDFAYGIVQKFFKNILERNKK